MNNQQPKNLSDIIRDKLNSLPEKDQQGNYNRAGWQFISLIVAEAAKNSINPQLQMLGQCVKLGAKRSIVDYASKKIEDWLDSILEDNNGFRSTSL